LRLKWQKITKNLKFADFSAKIELFDEEKRKKTAFFALC